MDVRTFADLVGYKPSEALPQETHGTTVLMLRCKEGILTLADRRATMGNLVMYDHADKIMPLDETTVIAVSGSFARAVEVARLLRHSFMYYSRMHMNEMSLEGKLQEISRTISSNIPNVMDGIGLFIPILAAYDRESERFEIYFFDAAGARFQNSEYACAGSGSERIRGVFEYLNRTGSPLSKQSMEDVLVEGMRMLDIASDLDSATGGFSKILPTAQMLTSKSNSALDQDLVRKAADKVLANRYS